MKSKNNRVTNNPMMYTVTPSRHGDIGIVWMAQKSAGSVVAILLPGKKKMERAIREAFPGAMAGRRREVTRLGGMLSRSMEGKNVTIPLDLFDMERLYPFQRKVLMKCGQVPRGKVISYGGLAKKIGTPRAARAVGTALARNPFPLALPCHRVVKSSGRPGNFGGSPAMKVALLTGEKVRLTGKGIIEGRYFW